MVLFTQGFGGGDGSGAAFASNLWMICRTGRRAGDMRSLVGERNPG
jgi:hypothetical protein